MLFKCWSGKQKYQYWWFCISLKPDTCRLCFFRNALNIQIFLKMHRSDYAERQLRVMQQVDEDHTLTQLANAWLNLAVVIKYFLFLFSSSCRLDIIVHFCNITFFEIRVVQRYRRHISSSKISLRSLRLQVWSWMERPFAACTWETLMKLKAFLLKHWPRQVSQ